MRNAPGYTVTYGRGLLGGGGRGLHTTFGKFRLLERIGGGRLSEVFRVGSFRSDEVDLMEERARTHIVLKRVAPQLINEHSFVQLVTREAGLLSRLTHPSLCVAQEMGVIDGCAFLTLDMIDGCTLRALLRRVSKMRIQLPTSAVLAITLQLAEVLDYLHRQGDSLVHLDLSPQNVMISRQGEVKLIDFGIARYLDGHNPPPLGGRIAGTIGYMSPEQARGERELDARADQFALGILLWELLSNQRLYPGNTSETWRRMRAGDVPSLDTIVPVPSDEVIEIAMRLVQVDPLERFAHLGETVEALRAISSAPLSGKRPLAALTDRLMHEEDFDPYDAVSLALGTTPTPVANIPTGEVRLDDYEELAISVDHGEGTPSAQMRAVVPEGVQAAAVGQDGRSSRPDSPFLEPSASFDLDLAAS